MKGWMDIGFFMVRVGISWPLLKSLDPCGAACSPEMLIAHEFLGDLSQDPSWGYPEVCSLQFPKYDPRGHHL